jgi:AAA ATPase domain
MLPWPPPTPTTPMRIFVSSPSDMAAERRIALNVLTRLRAEFKHHFDVREVLWEFEPLRATEHFQHGLVSPADCDIVVCLFWSRLGSPLPAEFNRPDGSAVTGTEWEFLVAHEAARRNGRPDILVYRRTSERLVSLSDPQALQRAQQDKQQVDDFFARHFHNADEAKTFKAAYWPFVETSQFEDKLGHHLTELLRRRVSEGTPQRDRDAVTWHRGSPFLGLHSFDPEHAEVYFGRSRARNLLLEQFRRQAEEQRPFVMVIGASGSGKSSLVKAGMLPLLTAPEVIPGTAECRWCVWKPSQHSGQPLAGLLRAITGAVPEMLSEDEPFEALQQRSLESAAVFEAVLRGALNAARSGKGHRAQVRLLLVIDQFEECFVGAEYSEALRASLFALLARLTAAGHTWIIGTLRSDFYAHTASDPALMELMRSNGQFHLAPPTPEELDQMIRLPAQAAGLRFEQDQDGTGLDATLRGAAGHSTGVLPLLSFMLDALYERRTAAGVLTFAAYRALGGLEGAIAQRANGIFAALDAEAQAALPSLLGALVSLNPGDSLTAHARMADWTAFAGAAPRRLAEAFVATRLLVVHGDAGSSGEGGVRVAHEALLQRWDRAQAWIQGNAELLRQRSRIVDLAHYWQQEGNSEGLLLQEGRALEAAPRVLENFADSLDLVCRAFIDQSMARQAARREQAVAAARRERLRHRMGLAVAAIAALSIIGICILVVRAQRIAVREQQAREQVEAEARARELLATVRRAGERAQSGEPLAASKILAGIKDIRQLDTQGRQALAGVVYQLQGSLPTAMDLDGWQPSVCTGLVQRVVASGVELMALRSGQRAEAATPPAQCSAQRFVLRNAQGGWELWRTDPPTQLALLDGDAGAAPRFSDDAAAVALQETQRITVHSSEDGRLLTSFPGLEGATLAGLPRSDVVWLRDAQQASVYAYADGAGLRTLQEPVFEPSQRLAGSERVTEPREPVWFAPEANRFATWSATVGLELWRLDNGQRLSRRRCPSRPKNYKDTLLYYDGGLSVQRIDAASTWPQAQITHSAPIRDFAVAGGLVVALSAEGLLLAPLDASSEAPRRLIAFESHATRLLVREDLSGAYLLSPGNSKAVLLQLDPDGLRDTAGNPLRAAVDIDLIQSAPAAGPLEYVTAGQRWIDPLAGGRAVAVGRAGSTHVLAVSGERNRIMVADSDTIQVWDLAAGKPRQQLLTGAAAGATAAFYAGDDEVVTLASEGKAQFWRMASSTAARRWNLASVADDVDLAANLSWLAAVDAQGLSILQLPGSQEVAEIRQQRQVSLPRRASAVRIHPLRSEVVVLDDSPALSWYAADDLRLLRREPLPMPGSQMRVDARGNILLSGANPADLLRWDDHAHRFALFPQWAPVTTAAERDGGELIIATADGSLTRRRLDSADATARSGDSEGTVRALGFRAGQTLAVVEASSRNYAIFRQGSDTEIARTQARRAPLQMAASIDGTVVALLHDDRSVSVIRSSERGGTYTLALAPPVQSGWNSVPTQPDLAFSQDGALLAVRIGNSRRGVHLIDTRTASWLTRDAPLEDARIAGFDLARGLLVLEANGMLLGYDRNGRLTADKGAALRPVRVQIDDLVLREQRQLVLRDLDHTGAAATLAADRLLASDGRRRAALASSDELTVYDFATGDSWPLGLQAPPGAQLRFSGDGRSLLIREGTSLLVQPLPDAPLQELLAGLLPLTAGQPALSGKPPAAL